MSATVPVASESVEPVDVALPDVEDALSERRMRACMYKRHVDPDQNAIASQGLLAWLIAHVEDNRDLSIDFSIGDLELVNRAELRRVVRRGSRGGVLREERILKLLAWALGMARHAVDVNAFLGGDESALIAGLYRPSSGQIYLVSGDRPKPKTIPVLAHELAHAATDQAFGLGRIRKKSLIDDRALAELSVQEGDANLVEFRFLSRFAPDRPIKRALAEQLKLADRFDKARIAGVPEMLIDQFIFPYQWGLAFVCAVYKKEGWRGVNRMYRHPPASSAEVMFPERFLKREKPKQPSRLGRLDKPWRRVERGTIGAAHLKSLFDAPGNFENRVLGKPIKRAASWNGGVYELWVNKGETIGAVGMGLVEHPDHPGVLCDSMHKWYVAAFFDAEPIELDDETTYYRSRDQLAAIRCSGRDVRIGIGPNLDLAEALL